MPTINLGKIRLNWRGEYDAATSYEPNDAVFYNGDSFVCLVAATGVTPFDYHNHVWAGGNIPTIYWEVIAKGATQLEYTGDLIYMNTTGPDRLAIGQGGQVLTATGSGLPVWNSQLGLPTHRQALTLGKWHDTEDDQAMNWGRHWHGMYLSTDRKRLYACGRTYYGNSAQPWGDSNTTADEYRSGFQPSIIFDELDEDDFIIDFFVKTHNTFFYTNKGYVYATGANGTGQLGDGTTTNRRWFKRVPGFGGVNKQAAKITLSGEDNTMSVYVLTKDGEIWSWGYNGYGCLGDGTQTQRTSPTAVTNVNGVVFTDVVGGGCYGSMMYGLTDNGDVWAWGSNRNGQAGDASWNNDKNTPFQTNLSNIVKIKSNQWRFTLHGVGGVPGGYTYALDDQGRLWHAGYNDYHASADGGTAVKLSWFEVVLPAGKSVEKFYLTNRDYSTNYIITTDGYLYAVGYGGYGKISNGSTANSSSYYLCQLPSGFQGNITDVFAIGGGSYGTTWVRAYTAAGGERWASFGYHGYGVIGDATESTANTTNHVREITKYMPWNTDGNVSGWKEIKLRSIDDASIYFAVVLMNDGTIYYLGRDDGMDRYAVETYYRNVGHWGWRRSMRQ